MMMSMRVRYDDGEDAGKDENDVRMMMVLRMMVMMMMMTTMMTLTVLMI